MTLSTRELAAALTWLWAAVACRHDAVLGAECLEVDPACLIMRGGAGGAGAAPPPAVIDAGPIDDAATPGECDPTPLVFRTLVCGLDGVLTDSPKLAADQAHTVHMTSNLSIETMLQVQAWNGCSPAVIETITVPVGPSELELCVPASADVRYLAIGLVSISDPILWTPEGFVGTVCAGCK